MATDPASSDHFEGDDFWEENKSKILLYGSVLLIGLVGFGVFEYQRQTQKAAAQAAYAQAATEAELQNVAKDFSGTVAAGDASLQLADKLRGEKKYDEAVTVLREFIAKYPEHPLIAGGWISLASTLELQGKADDALEIYQQTATKFPNSFAAPLAMNAQARLLAAKGKKDEAARLYEDVAARYPESLYAREAMRELRLLKR